MENDSITYLDGNVGRAFTLYTSDFLTVNDDIDTYFATSAPSKASEFIVEKKDVDRC